MMDEQIVKRAFRETDTAIIYDTWAKGAWYAKQKPIRTDRDQWFQSFHAYIQSILERAEISVACLSTDPDFIVGYAILDKEALEWVYVKNMFRRQGIAAFLLKNLPIAAVNTSTITKIGQQLLPKLSEERDL